MSDSPEHRRNQSGDERMKSNDLSKSSRAESASGPIPTARVVVQDGESPRPNDDNEGCPCTPTAAECKIPTATACPPAPKKARAAATPACCRRLLQLELVRILPEDVERLFHLPPPPPILTTVAAGPLSAKKKRKRREFEEK